MSDFEYYWTSQPTTPNVSVLPNQIIHRENVYRLIRPEQVAGLSLDEFCEILESSVRQSYAPAELLNLYNFSPAAKSIDGLGIKISDRGWGRRRIPKGEFALKFPDTTKLIVSTWRSGSAIPGTETIRDIISVPIAACLKSAPDISDGYTVYAHTFTTQASMFGVRGPSEPSYVGVTKRGWPVRWHEHIASARSGSPYRFHEAIRRFNSDNAVFHEVMVCGVSLEEAMRAEEWAVDTFSLYPKGFNMIPGGFAGIKYLAGKGFPQSPKAWEHRERAIRSFTTACARKGIANPLMSSLWRDDDYAASIICSNPNNFNRQTVQQARLMSELGKSPDQIAVSLGCAPQRVKKLLTGKTYSRVA